MPEANSNPQPTDAILGGQTPAPYQGAILGGIEGIQQKLNHEDLSVRLEAVDQAWSYGTAGLGCLHQALSDRSKLVRRRSRWLLRQPQDLPLINLPLWNLTERFDCLGNNHGGLFRGHVEQFAGRQVWEFDREQALPSPQQFAYAFRCDYDDEDDSVADQIDVLLGMPGAELTEALVIGAWVGGESVSTGDSTAQTIVESLVALRDRFPNLKALFLGDIESEECEISWIIQSDMSPVLQAFPQLEVLQVRGGEGLRIDPTLGLSRHENLKALILETGGLSRSTVEQIYEWEFPALEHLELWFGSPSYGGDCWDRDLLPLLEDLKFPNLTYLGLRNSGFADEIAAMIVRSPLLAGLQVLDLSLGTLTDAGAQHLLDCAAIRDLETLNVSASYLSGAMIDQLRALGIQVLAHEQREEDDYEEPSYRRYCVVSE
ncbi:STM4015 family protein [Leptolyngbya sp. AN03gr2]|uniref:STM4015 family protein n=1 Tax=unclassified Leptolyngbya TaxID=2650499 RepID=UPI003D321AE2